MEQAKEYRERVLANMLHTLTLGPQDPDAATSYGCCT